MLRRDDADVSVYVVNVIEGVCEYVVGVKVCCLSGCVPVVFSVSRTVRCVRCVERVALCRSRDVRTWSSRLPN